MVEVVWRGGGYLSSEQFEHLKEQFYDNFVGSKNSGKPLILEGGLKWQELSNSDSFEKFIELKESITRDIAMAFNIPTQLLGINKDSTYNNMQEARLAFWEENIIPMLENVSGALTNWFSNIYGDDLIISFNKDAISAVNRRREKIWDKLNHIDFMTINEKRSMAGLPSIDNSSYNKIAIKDKFTH
ncbi:MAG TPA: phage portal protein [Candidatus Megaira endosymbiont of Hartmannula sinica]|nr:phage portal protein [Candidatus Megaera endosymbiont of Hartmannula sinica]